MENLASTFEYALMTRHYYFFREWREYRGLTIEQLAEKAGLSNATISNMERGVAGFRRPALEKIADALDCEPGELLLVNPNPKPGSNQNLYTWSRYRELNQ